MLSPRLSLETSPLSQWSPERDTVVTLWVRQLVSLLVAQPVEGVETWVEGRGESPLRSEQCNGASTRRSAVSTASRSIVAASRSRILVRRVGVDGVRALYDEVAFASCERSVHSLAFTLAPPPPPLDALAAGGLKLTSHYAYKYCAPARGAFLTGRLPYRLASTQTWSE